MSRSSARQVLLSPMLLLRFLLQVQKNFHLYLSHYLHSYLIDYPKNFLKPHHLYLCNGFFFLLRHYLVFLWWFAPSHLFPLSKMTTATNFLIYIYFSSFSKFKSSTTISLRKQCSQKNNQFLFQ